MATAAKLSDGIVSDAKIGKTAEENPDLTYEFIKNTLVAIQKAQEGKLEPYIFDKN